MLSRRTLGDAGTNAAAPPVRLAAAGLGAVASLVMEEPTTKELRIRQERLEAEERSRSDQPGKEGEKHERRAERASYLREKLEQRAESEKRARDEEPGR